MKNTCTISKNYFKGTYDTFRPKPAGLSHRAGTTVFGLCLTFLFSGALLGQTQFQKTAGSGSDDRNYHLAAMPDGGVVATGYTEDITGNNNDSYLIKYNRFGEVEWAKTYGGPDNEASWDVISTQSGDIAGAGSSGSLGTPHVAGVVTKADTNGDVIWSTGVISADGRVEFYRLIETSTGHFLAAGLTGTTSNQDEMLLCKFTSQGTLLWGRTIGTSDDDEIMGMIETSEGNYLLAGLTSDANGNGGNDFAAVKTDTAGNVIWKKNYGGNNEDRLNSVVEVNNAYYFTGWSRSVISGQRDIVVMKTDTAGNIDFVYDYGTPETERAFNLVFTPSDSSLTIGGYTEHSGAVSNRNTLLLNIDLDGNINWTKSYGSQQTDGHWPTGLAVNDDEGYYVLGTSNSYSTGGEYDLYLVKTDAAGNSGGCNEKNPPITRTAETNWSGTNFGSDASITLTGAVLTITPGTWNITSSTECCSLYSEAGFNEMLCPDDTVTLNAGVVTGYQYDWTLNGNPVQGGGTYEVTFGNAGTYEVNISAPGSSCASLTETFNITDDTKPQLGFDDYYEFCGNDSLTLSTSAVFDSLFWYSVAASGVVNTGNNYTFNTSDTMLLGALTSAGCVFRDTLIAIATPVPDELFTSDTVHGTSTADLTVTGTWDSYNWSTGENTETITVGTSGWYSVTVEDDNGCIVSDSVYASVIEVGISELNKGKAAFHIYPNPAVSHLTVESEIETGTTITAVIYDAAGRQLKSEKWHSDKMRRELSLSDLTSGFYLLELSTDNGTRKAVRFVKK